MSQVSMGFFGEAGILHEKMLILLHGLHLCWSRGFKYIYCISDSLTTIDFVHHEVSPYHMYNNEIEMICVLL